MLQVLTASETYPETADPPLVPQLRRFRSVLFDVRRRNRDRALPFLTGALLCQKGLAGKLLRRWLDPERKRSLRLELAIAKKKPVLVHSHSVVAGASAVRAAKRAGIPLVVSVTGSDIGRALMSEGSHQLLKRVFDAADAILVEGASSAEDLWRLGCAPRKVTTIPRPVQVEKIAPRGPRGAEARQNDPRLRMLFCGPLVERQGIAFALEAVARLARGPPGVHFRLIGTGPLRRPLSAIAKHLGIEEHVEFVGQKRLEFFLESLAESDVLVCPSIVARDGDREGGAPPAVLLSLAAAVPVVSTKHADIPEVVQDSKTGFLAEERDVESLTVCLARVRNDLAFADELGRAGRKLVEQQNDFPNVMSRLEGVYLEALEQP